MYYSEELNIKKLFMMFKEQHRTVAISYETYRYILNSEFNILFGYPRTYTCTNYDEFLVKLKTSFIEKDENEFTNLATMNVLYKKKTETFHIH